MAAFNYKIPAPASPIMINWATDPRPFITEWKIAFFGNSLLRSADNASAVWFGTQSEGRISYYWSAWLELFIDQRPNWTRSNLNLQCHLNPITAKLFNLNFHPLEVVSRWRDPQLQVSENYSDLTIWRLTVFKYCWLISHSIFPMFKGGT